MNVPAELRIQMLKWGYCKDEFTDNGVFPYQMYIPESRRTIGEYIMTEGNCVGKLNTSDGIGMAASTMDSHNCQRIVWNGMVKNEGDVQEVKASELQIRLSTDPLLNGCIPEFVNDNSDSVNFKMKGS